jgi:DNA-binding transcriptional regulator LsrR (DeoR family)
MTREIVNNLSTSVNSSSLEWRRNKVQELASQGYNQSEISRILQLSQPTINRDIAYLRQQAKMNIKRYIDERLPEEYEKCMVGLTSTLREAWNTAQNTQDKRERIQALSLAKECYSMKLELLTNAIVVVPSCNAQHNDYSFLFYTIS